MQQLKFRKKEVAAFQNCLKNIKQKQGLVEGGFDITEGITVICRRNEENTTDYDHQLEIIVNQDGFKLFTRGTGDTLRETGSYGFGPNHGKEIATKIEEWVAEAFGESNNLEFDFDKAPDGMYWVFQTDIRV